MFGFLIKNPKHGLVYNGDILQYDKLIDSAEAEARFRAKKGGNLEEVEFSIYGEKKKYKIPVATETNIEKCKIITKQFNAFIREKAKYKMFNDIALGYRDEILKNYECVINPDGRICFFDMQGQKKDIELKTTEEMADFVMIREFMGGYVRVEPYIYCYMEGQKKKSIPVNLHTDYNTGGLGFVIRNNYTVGLRNAMFQKYKEMFETSTLLQPRQYDVLQKMAHKTFVCGSRRAGKTFLSAFICIREIMRNSFDPRTFGRPLQVIYIANKSSVFTSVIQYIRGMCKGMGQDFDNMFWRDTTIVRGGKVLCFGSGKDVLGRVIFASAKEDGVGLGLFADMVIIDEAGKVPQQAYENILPIVMTEGAKLLCISTMYVDNLKGWFFDEVMDAEKYNNHNFKEDTIEFYKQHFDGLKIIQGNANKEYNDAVKLFYQKYNKIALRYTIDDITFLSEAEKEQQKEEYKKKFGMVKYYCELYSRFVDVGKVFEYENVLVEQISETTKYKFLVLGYDPASLADKAGVTILGYDNARKKIVVLYADYLNTNTGQYQEQITQIVHLFNAYTKYLEIPQNFYKVVDSTQSGVVDAFEISNFYFDRRYRWTSGNDVVESKKIYTEIKIPKKNLIETSETAFVNNFVEIPQKMTKLIDELDHYQKIEHATGKIEYGGVGNTDDIVSSFMMAYYYMYHELGVKYEVSDFRETPDINKGLSQDYMAKLNTLKIAEKNVKDSLEAYHKARQIFFNTNVF